MKPRASVLPLLLLALWACEPASPQGARATTASSPPASPAAAPPSSEPRPAPSASADATSAAASASVGSPAAPPDFVVRDIDAEGELQALLRDEAAEAAHQGLRPVVYFHAGWCPPCRAFTASLADRAVQQALRGVYLIKLNIDAWPREKRRAAGIEVRVIPSFVRVDARGRGVGVPLSGEGWKTPAQVAPALGRFLGNTPAAATSAPTAAR